MAGWRFRAFSLAEVLLAIGTLVLVILTILALVISLNRGSRKNLDTSAAQYAADQIINLVVERAQRDTGALHAAFWGNDTTVKGSVISNQTEFFYTLDATTVKDTSGQPLDGAALPNNRMKLIQVELYWWNPSNNSTRAGYGRLTTQVTRLIGEKSN
ncbi:hypothetical protein JST97_32260 [bacterium]|nr:hypothetical protein [bacterium]